jgi:hypothetical protein
LSPFCVGGVPHTIGIFLTRIKILVQTSSQSEVCTQSYGSPKSRESQFWEFRDSNLRVSKQNDIRVLVPWVGINYTIRGKVWLPSSPGCDESCEFVFVRDLFVHQKLSNYALTNLLFGLCRFESIIELLINLPSPHFRALAPPLYPQSVVS